MRKPTYSIYVKIQRRRSAVPLFSLRTVKFLNFQMQEKLAVINLKFKQRCQTLGYFTKKMQMEKQTVKT